MKNAIFTLALSLAIFAGLAAAPAARADRGPHAAPAQLAQASATPGAKGAEKAADQAGAKAAPLIDINTASEAELATLPGIGEARSKAIVKGRPYARKDELVRRKIIPQSVYDNIREQVIAKQKP